MQDKALSLFNEGVRFSLDADQLLSAGRADQAAELYTKALQCYSAVLELEPSQPAFVSAKAFALARLGQVGEAAALFELAIELDPTQAENFYQLGLCFFELGMPEDGILTFHEAFGVAGDASIRKRAGEEITQFGKKILGYGIHCHQLQNPATSKMLIENAISAFKFSLECDPDAIASQKALEQAQAFMRHKE